MSLIQDDDLGRVWLELGSVNDRIERIERRLLVIKMLTCLNLVLMAAALAVLLARG